MNKVFKGLKTLFSQEQTSMPGSALYEDQTNGAIISTGMGHKVMSPLFESLYRHQFL